MASMWKRLPLKNRTARDSTIGNPVLIDTTFDEKQLQHMADISEAQTSLSAGSDDTVRKLPELPFRAMPPQLQDKLSTTRAVSHAPTVSTSSAYSQPSPDPRFDQYSRRSPVASSYYGDVSPLSSPGPYEKPKGTQSGDVSPIESANYAYGAVQKPNDPSSSQIPVLRKVTPSNDLSASRLRKVSEDEPARWDRYTGERTTAATGLTGTVKVGQPVYPLKPPPIRGLPSNPRPIAPASGDNNKPRPTAQGNASRLADPGLYIDTRPPWKGASGRQAIVAPVADKPGQQVPIPRRSSRRLNTKSPEPQITPTSANSGSALRSARSNQSDTQEASMGEDHVGAEETIKPVVPLKAGSNTPRGYTSPTTQTFNAARGYPSPVSPAGSAATPLTTNQQQQGSAIKSNSPAANRSTARKSIDTQHSRKSSGGPNSRFSWTTYNTDTTYQHSPPPSPPPPMPATYAAQAQSTPTPAPRLNNDLNSIMNRKRPVPTANSPQSPIIPSSGSMKSFRRKPVGSMLRDPSSPQEISTSIAPAVRSPDNYSPTGRTPSILSTATAGTAKALPPPPAALTASNLVETLQAQLDDLTQQRYNLQRVIRDFQATQPQNPLVSDFRSRREAERKLACWKEELAAIELLEHDVGLRLHRAWKKKERAEGIEPSALWIKRVVS